jgi:predicted nucleic-acid-binding protein
LIAVDTNVLVRFLTQDHPQQAKKAAELLEKAEVDGEPCFISDIVLCEMVWVLEECYSQKKANLIQSLEMLLKVDGFRFQDKNRIFTAIEVFRNGKGDFSDYLIGMQAKGAGARCLFTFDKALVGDPYFLAW